MFSNGQLWADDDEFTTKDIGIIGRCQLARAHEFRGGSSFHVRGGHIIEVQSRFLLKWPRNIYFYLPFVLRVTY